MSKLFTKAIILFCGICLFSISCTTDYTGEFPSNRALPVLNAVINSDSLLTANLTWSQPPRSAEKAKPITNAVVDLYCDGTFKATLSNSDNGNYSLENSYTLFKDSTYTLKAYGADFNTIIGTTKVPQTPIIECTTYYENYTNQFKINITDTASTYSALWIYVRDVDSTNTILNIKSDHTLFGDGRLADDFNRSIDASGTMSGGSFIYVYEQCIRIDRQSLVNCGGEMLFNAGSYSPSGRKNVYIVVASPEYDKYYKAVFMQEVQSLNLELPFTYQSIMVPSNISNGIGLFGGYTVKEFKFFFGDDPSYATSPN